MRNKLLLYYLLAIFSALCFFTACSDEDDDMPDTHASTSGEFWENVAGVYRGKMEVEVDGVMIDTIDQQVKISSDDRNKMTLYISSLIVDEVSWNNMFFKNVYFSKKGNKVSFTAETIQYVGQIPNVSLVITGTISGGNMDMSILANSVTIRPTTLSMKAEKLDNLLNSESSILKITLNHELVIRQPVHGGGNTWVFYVSDTLDMDSTELLIRPEFELSEGATISCLDSIMDFSEPVTYTVWAEDSIHRAEYKVIWNQSLIHKYDIGRWHTKDGWDEPYSGWATNNGALNALIDSAVYNGDYAVKRVKGMNVGDWATEMTTVMTGEGEDKSIFAGSLFQGTFDLSMKPPLGGLVYGVPSLDRYAPIAVRGYYKYTPSNKVYVADSLIMDSIPVSDTCCIRAILYEVDNLDNNLDSLNYMNDPRVVYVAEMGLQAGKYQSEFTEFSINFNLVGNYFATRRYKIAVICSSSRDVDKKRGAPGSVLTVGGIEVMFNFAY